MTAVDFDPKDDLRRYLDSAHDAVLWKLDGVGEYDVRRPLTPTGTNLLGLVKHLASVEAEYFGLVFGRPFPEPLPWLADAAAPDADMWATADESRDDIVALYRRVWQHTHETIDVLDLDAVGEVPWWPPERRRVTLARILVHMVAEVNRHAGHIDILRETIDGAAGHRRGFSNLSRESVDEQAPYRAKLQAVAEQFRA